MDKLMVISGIFFVLHGASYAQFFRRDYYFYHGAGGWLKFHLLPVKWEEAVLTCQREGAIIASPINEEIATALSTIMVEHGVTTVPIFTGISNIYATSEYQSMEGVPLSNTCISWSAQTDLLALGSKSNCIAMTAKGTVTAVPCSDRHPFACYRKTGVQLNECGPVDAEFVLDNRTGSCYKAVNELVTWSDAFKICAREGAHLAVINSQAEAEVILELAKKLVNQNPIVAWKYVQIGFRAWGEPATWMTIHGQSISDAGYAKWAPNEPNHANERCGTVYAGGALQDGLLNNAQCGSGYERKFICEIDPKIED